MRSFAILGLLLFSQSTFAAQGNPWSYVSCRTTGASPAFTIEFLGHPVHEQTLSAVFKDSEGKEIQTWNRINGIARRSFIKISQEQRLGPHERMVTNVLAYGKEVGPNEPFAAKYQQFVQRYSGNNVEIVTHDLECISPF